MENSLHSHLERPEEVADKERWDRIMAARDEALPWETEFDGLINRTIATVTGPKGEVQQTTVTTSPVASSSVEIGTDAKGQPKLSVKVYNVDPDEALVTALRLYEHGLTILSVLAQQKSHP